MKFESFLKSIVKIENLPLPAETSQFKMSPPYRLSQFEIVYGIGIDKLAELMELINEHEIGRKYGKTITINETKYDLEEFKELLMDNKEFQDSIKEQIINKINQTEIKTEEDVTSEL